MNKNIAAATFFLALFSGISFAEASHSYDHYYNYTSSVPKCAMTLTYGVPRTTTNYGSYLDEPATLNWTTWNATSAYITPDVGSVGTSGSRVVYPRGNQTYLMRVNGPWGEGTCQVTAVHPYATIYGGVSYRPSQYTQPYDYNYYANYYPNYTGSYVALKQMPYTGADFGPMGTALVWLSIVLVGAVGAATIAVSNTNLRNLILYRS